MGPKIGKPLLKTRVESLSLRKKADASRRQTSNKTVSPICLGFVLMGSTWPVIQALNAGEYAGLN